MPAIATDIVTLAQAKTQLGMTDPAHDTQLEVFISAASQMIVNRIGPVAGSPTVSEWHDGGSPEILLYIDAPIQSVTSVTESIGSQVYTLTQVTLDSGSVATPYGYTVDLDAGLFVRRAAGAAVPFAPGSRNIHITAVAGYATVPADIVQKALFVIQRMWETQRPNTGRRGVEPIEGSTRLDIGRLIDDLFSDYNLPGIA